ncbi:MAG: hypothetical protein J6J24_00440 [Clostridia bacterium]|nr:hypothetical protein [Clostridia bacterium]
MPKIFAKVRTEKAVRNYFVSLIVYSIKQKQVGDADLFFYGVVLHLYDTSQIKNRGNRLPTLKMRLRWVNLMAEIN